MNDKYRKKRKRFICIILSMALLLTAAGGGLYYFKYSGQSEETETMAGFEAGMPQGGMDTSIQQVSTVSIISGSGTTYFGTGEQKFQMSFTDDDGDSVYLQVEEVYVSAGDEVIEGTPIYKLTDESVEKVRDILDDAYESASTIYNNAYYTYNKGVLSAQCTYLQSMGLSETALAAYELEAESLNAKLASALEELTEAELIIEQNPQLLEGLYDDKDTYIELQEDYQEKLDNLKISLISAKAALSEAQEEYEEAKTDYDYLSKTVSQDIVSQDTVATGGDASGYEAALLSYEAAALRYEEAQTALNKAQSNVDLINAHITQYEKDLKSIQADYDAAQEKLDEYYNEYVKADENMESYQESYDELLLKLSQEITRLENEYEADVFTYTNAEHYYELQLETLENTLEESISEYEKTKEALEEFESFCGDGIVRADRDGTIVMVPYFEGRPLSTGSILTYYDYDNLSVQVSVGQSDIASLNVGDAVTVVSGTTYVEGAIQAISTSASGQGISRVYYTVTVSIPAESGISSGTAATVYFSGMNGGSNEKGN